MKYTTEGGLLRIADSIADLRAMYRLLTVKIVSRSKLISDRIKRPGVSSLSDLGQAEEEFVWDSPKSLTYLIHIPKGHGLLKLSQGDVRAIEDFVAQFPPQKCSLYFIQIASNSSETHVTYVFTIGYDESFNPQTRGCLAGGIGFELADPSDNFPDLK